jgi:hypothetical protein
MALQSIVRRTAAVALGLVSLGAHAAFTITLNFTGGLSATEQGYFTAAKSFWESAITGYQAGPLTGITINASGFAGAVGGVLGSAGWTNSHSVGGFQYATAGEMEFDTLDIPVIGAGTFAEVVKHEMAHALGFGTLWVENGVYVDGSGAYTGSNALNQYRVEYSQPAAAFVPIELGGGPGTADGHWNESDGGTTTTGTVDTFGRDMAFELMTGWVNHPGTYTSRTTLASFQDIGYTVNLSAVPEPGTWVLWLLGLAAMGRWAHSRRTAA